MAENSRIEWTDCTFNPWMGCTKVSPACAHCYAERDFDHRYKKVAWGPSGTRVVTGDSNWKKPLQWNERAARQGSRMRVFCASLADVFERWDGPMTGTDESMSQVRMRLFALIDATPWLDWLLLTKRPENFEFMRDKTLRENVWLGASVESQEYMHRCVHLFNAKRAGWVAKTFASCEPLLGPVSFRETIAQGAKTIDHLNREGGLDWVIAGGESGPSARPANPDWFRSVRDQCRSAGVPFHFKQWGEFDETQTRVSKKQAGRLLDGVAHDGLPDPHHLGDNE